jgi:hypothetical protein
VITYSPPLGDIKGLSVSKVQILQHLSQHYQVVEDKVRVHKFCPFDFLLIFSSVAVATHVLHVPLPRDASLILVVQR